MKNNKLVGLGLGLVIIIVVVGYFILNPGKQPKYLVHRYPFSLDVFKQVSLTTYTTDSNETDSTPLITASGLKFEFFDEAFF